MKNHQHYAYRVLWSPEDEEFVALCAEFPSLSYLAPSHTEALNGLMATVTQVVADMLANNEVVPETLASKNYSGNFMLRIL